MIMIVISFALVKLNLQPMLILQSKQCLYYSKTNTFSGQSERRKSSFTAISSAVRGCCFEDVSGSVLLSLFGSSSGFF